VKIHKHFGGLKIIFQTQKFQKKVHATAMWLFNREVSQARFTITCLLPKFRAPGGRGSGATAEAQRAAPAEGRPEADTDPCSGPCSVPSTWLIVIQLQ